MVDSIETLAKSGVICKSLMFMFTNNSTAEAAVNKGNSPSRKLHELVVRLRHLQMKYCFELYVTHVSGTRMIDQGTDGLSRGSVNTLGLNSQALRKHVPLNQRALERSNNLKEWMRSWVGKKHFFLEPKNWFVEAHDLRFEGRCNNLTIEHTTYI